MGKIKDRKCRDRSGRFANELFRQRLIRQCLRSIHQRPKSLRQHPTGQFANILKNIGTQGVQELFFCELQVSEIGAFMELFTVLIWLI